MSRAIFVKNNKRAWLFFWLIIAMLGWGFSWVNAKVLSTYITAEEVTSYRFLISTLATLPVIIWLRLSWHMSIKTLLLATLTAVFMVAYNRFFFLGTKLSYAGLGAAIVTMLIPIYVYLMWFIFGRKKSHLKDWFALLLGALGVMTMMRVWQFDWAQILTTANIYFLLAAFCQALVSISGSFSKKTHFIVFSFYVYFLTTVIDYVFIFTNHSGSVWQMDFYFWLNLLTLSIISTTFSSSIYFLASQRLGSNQTSTFTLLVPFFALTLSYYFLKEQVNMSTLIGLLMTIIALLVLNRVKVSIKWLKR